MCINAACELVDVHQLYLNPSRPLPSWSLDAQQANASTTDESHSDMVNVTNTSPENEPILLWSCTDLDFRRRHDVVVTLVERNPALGSNRGDFRKAITLSHVSYTVVVTEWYVQSPSSRARALLLIKVDLAQFFFQGDIPYSSSPSP